MEEKDINFREKERVKEISTTEFTGKDNTKYHDLNRFLSFLIGNTMI